MSLITNILDIRYSIKEEYNNSKLPKFIKNIIFKRKEKILNANIDKLANITALHSELIDDYLEHIYKYTITPKSTITSYKSCVKCHRGKFNRLVATFQFPLEDGCNEIVILSPADDMTYNVSYMFVKNGKNKSSFVDDHVVYFIYKDSPTNFIYTKNNAIKLFIEKIRKDMVEYVRSENLNE